MGLNLSLDDMQDLFNRCCGRALCGWKHDLLNQLDILTLMLETSFDYLGLTSAIEWVMTVWDKLLVTSWTRFGTIHSESLESWMWNANMKVVTVICAVSLPVFQTRYRYMSMVKVRRSRIKQKQQTDLSPTFDVLEPVRNRHGSQLFEPVHNGRKRSTKLATRRSPKPTPILCRYKTPENHFCYHDFCMDLDESVRSQIEKNVAAAGVKEKASLHVPLEPADEKILHKAHKMYRASMDWLLIKFWNKLITFSTALKILKDSFRQSWSKAVRFGQLACLKQHFSCTARFMLQWPATRLKTWKPLIMNRKNEWKITTARHFAVCCIPQWKKCMNIYIYIYIWLFEYIHISLYIYIYIY